MITPVNPKVLNKMLKETDCDIKETKFLVDGFTRGFDILYEGPANRRDEAKNLPFREVGSNRILWDKIMTEVNLERNAGPYDRPPYKNYVQSPIGLVPKAGGKTRLIFHLSYDFKGGHKSINHHTPKKNAL